MDEETRKIIERTKERREKLKLMSETDGAYRKRRPLSEDLSANVETVQDDDSPKRQCLRSAEQNVKPDTPAIRSVQSRRNELTNICLSSDDGEYVPVPIPRKSLCQEENREPNQEVFKPQCRSRLAKLAQRINAWDDDYSKHDSVGRPNSVYSVDKESDVLMTAASTEVSLGTRDSRSRSTAPIAPHMRSPRSKSAAPLATTSPAPVAMRSKSPGPTLNFGSRSPAPLVPSLMPNDDLETAIVNMSWQQKSSRNNKISTYTKVNGQYHLQNIPSEIPVNARGFNDSINQGETTDDEPTNKPVSERLAKWSRKVSKTETNSASPVSPCRYENIQPNSKTVTPIVNRCSQNLSSKVAQLEKSLGVPSTPKQNTVAMSNQHSSQSPGSSMQVNIVSSVTSTAIHNTPAAEPVNVKNEHGGKRRESFEPTSQPVSQRMAEWQKKVDTLEVLTEKEPTAYPVNARMSAWEQVTASGSTESNKMIKPKGAALSCPSTPTRPLSANIPRSACIPKSPAMTRRVQSSVIKTNSVDAKSPSPTKPLSPSKASCAMKAIQQRLFESQHQNTTTQSLAERIRQERMAELKVLENRWHNGIIKDQTVKPDQERDVNDPSATVSNGKRTQQLVATTGVLPPPPPPPLPTLGKTTASAPSTKTTTAFAGDKNSIFKLIAAPQNSAVLEMKSALTNPEDIPLKNVIKQVRFEDSFESSDDCYGYENYPQESSVDDISDDTDAERTLESRQDLQYMEPDFEEDYYSSSEENEALCRAAAANNGMSHPDYDESDDVSISAFVPESVRQQCKLSLQTESSTNIIELAKRQHQENSKSQNYQPHGNLDSTDDTGDGEYDSDDMESMGTTSVDDLIDDALESDTDDNELQRTPVVSANKRGSHFLATCTDSCYDSTTDDDVVMRRKSPLLYSISMYRSKRYSNNVTPVQKIVRNSRLVSSEEDMETAKPKEDSRKSILERIKQLNNQVSLEQTVILQTSNALNQCCTEGSNFSGSTQQVECHKLLLIACQKRRAFLEEIQRLKNSNCLNPFGPGTKGTLTISDIRLPLKKDFVNRLSTMYDLNVFYYVILIRNGPQVFFTQLMSTHDPMVRGSLDFPNMIKLTDIASKFQVTLELYEMKLSKDRSCKKKKSKKCKAMPLTPISNNPVGLTSIHSSSFTLTWSSILQMSNIDKSSFTMDRVPYDAPLIGSIYLRMKCNMETNISESGFLTMFEDVSGLGAWHRRWCVISGNKLKYWKYPDDENRKDPLGYIDLKKCITEKVGLISRDICARPNTFEMCTVRPLRPGEEDSLITRKHHTMATIRHMLSADTKEERLLWCNKLNEALENVRAWQLDALKPIKVPSRAV